MYLLCSKIKCWTYYIISYVCFVCFFGIWSWSKGISLLWSS